MGDDPVALLQRLLEEFHEWRIQEFPEYATTADVHAYNHQLESLSLKKYEERKIKCDEFLVRLKTIGRDKLCDLIDLTNYDLLEDHLVTFIDGYKWRYHGACNPVCFLENTHINFKSFLLDATPFKKKDDFTEYAKRLHCIQTQVDEQIELMKRAMEMKTTMHRLSVEKVPGQLLEILEMDIENNPFYEPCVKHLDVVDGEQDKKDICHMVNNAIKEAVNPAFSKLRHFLDTEYLKATREQIGAETLPDGKEYYQACLRWHLSTNHTSEEVHKIGLKEVSRIQELMHKVMEEVEFKGTLQEFITQLRNDPKFYHESKDDLLSEYKSIIQERINPKLKILFHKPPPDECDVREMPFDGPGGQYTPPDDEGTRPGVFHVNLTCPSSIPRFGMTVLTLHEANPGHHMQFSIARQQTLPEFRRKIDYRNMYAVPYIFPSYTAYCEGWALYSEDLGIEMDVYKDPFELFGKYTDEMLRACRLVVDTGLHSFGWSKEKALEYMFNNCMLPINEIENEVCRYITWPGQACAYKIGQLKIKELRKMAEEELGSKFDVKGFHNIILSLSSVPLNLLEKHIKVWIERNKI